MKKRKIQTMLEVNTSREESKFGFQPEDDQGLLESIELNNINVIGLMTLGPKTKESKETERSFRLLRKIKNSLNKQLPKNKSKRKVMDWIISNFNRFFYRFNHDCGVKLWHRL